MSVWMRLAITGALFAAVAWAWSVSWRAFGGDVAAMIPAALVCLLPIAWSLARRGGWHGLMLAVLVIAGLAAVLSVVTRLVAHVLVVLVLTASVLDEINERRVRHV